MEPRQEDQARLEEGERLTRASLRDVARRWNSERPIPLALELRWNREVEDATHVTAPTQDDRESHA